MLIHKPTPNEAPFSYPTTNESLVRYMDLAKYVSMLQRQALFFCRIDKLNDPYEGLPAKLNFKMRVREKQHLRDVVKFYNREISDEEILESEKKFYEFQKNEMRAVYTVNCWNRKEGESSLLWGQYSDFKQGIMVKSSVNRMIEAFKNVSEKVYMTNVEYIDYETDYMPDGNLAYPYFHKQKVYSEENELRFIHRVQTENDGWNYDWKKEEVEAGIYIRVDVNELIDEVIISPDSSNWFISMVKEITKKYGLDKEIKKSTITTLGEFPEFELDSPYLKNTKVLQSI